ncbi:hypothetical protein H0H93_014580 [Arthromyces matolae]|nr:hypothetical protein H0H93_014580 [Arthromyces matolae]
MPIHMTTTILVTVSGGIRLDLYHPHLMNTLRAHPWWNRCWYILRILSMDPCRQYNTSGANPFTIKVHLQKTLVAENVNLKLKVRRIPPRDPDTNSVFSLPSDSPRDSSAMQKKTKYQTAAARTIRSYRQSLALYEAYLADPVIRSHAREEQKKWLAEQKETNLPLFKRYNTAIEDRRAAWSAPNVNFTATELEIMELGYTRERFMGRPTGEQTGAEFEWRKKVKSLTILFQNLARDLNIRWNNGGPSKKGES